MRRKMQYVILTLTYVVVICGIVFASLKAAESPNLDQSPVLTTEGDMWFNSEKNEVHIIRNGKDVIYRECK